MKRYLCALFCVGGIFFSPVTKVAADNLCVEGNIAHATAYKAFLSVPEYLMFSFGATIPFAAEDDPNGSVEYPGVYTAPLTGYYAVTLSLGNVGIDPGLPMNSLLKLSVLKNGVALLTNDIALPDAASQANKSVTGVVRLNAGDLVSSQLKGFIVDPAGMFEAEGTVYLSGPVSFFSLHYLSSSGPLVCGP